MESDEFMKITKAKPEDAEAVYHLICALEKTSPPQGEFVRVYQKNLLNPEILYLVCKFQGRVIAFGSLHMQLLLHHCGAVAEIQELVVQPNLRGEGVGAALFSALKAEARQRNCVLLEVCCNRGRERAHRFYEKCGMERSHYKFTLKMD